MNYEDKSSGIGICCLCIFALAIIGGTISFYVFGIIFLIEDYDEAKDCKTSDLWAYVLTVIISGLIQSSVLSKNKKNNDENIKYDFVTLFISFLINSIFIIWGGIELYDKAYNNNCKELRESKLYTFAFAIFIISCGIIINMLACCYEINQNTKQEQPNKELMNVLENTIQKFKEIDNKNKKKNETLSIAADVQVDKNNTIENV